MPFVSRNAEGEISAVSQLPTGECAEEVAASDPALARFLGALQPGVTALQQSDQGFIRVLEDVVDLLIEKGLIAMSDLPQDARDKIAQRKALRRSLHAQGGSR